MKTDHEDLLTRTTHRSLIPMVTTTCRHRRGAVLKGRSRTVIDDSGSLAITAWTCSDCGELFEEIHILSRNGKSAHRPIRYSVAPQNMNKGSQPVSGRH